MTHEERLLIGLLEDDGEDPRTLMAILCEPLDRSRCRWGSPFVCSVSAALPVCQPVESLTNCSISLGGSFERAPTTTQCRARGSRIGIEASSGLRSVSSR